MDTLPFRGKAAWDGRTKLQWSKAHWLYILGWVALIFPKERPVKTCHRWASARTGWALFFESGWTSVVPSSAFPGRVPVPTNTVCLPTNICQYLFVPETFLPGNSFPRLGADGEIQPICQFIDPAGSNRCIFFPIFLHGGVNFSLGAKAKEPAYPLSKQMEFNSPRSGRQFVVFGPLRWLQPCIVAAIVVKHTPAVCTRQDNSP